MSWREFSYLLEGISGDTPLGRIVSIRAENDPETLKNFTADEKRIRNDYRKKLAGKKSQEEVKSALDQFKNAFLQLAK